MRNAFWRIICVLSVLDCLRERGRIDEHFVYGRLDFAGKVSNDQFEIVVNQESWESHAERPKRELRLEAVVEAARIQWWRITARDDERVLVSSKDQGEAAVALGRNFEFRVPLTWLSATMPGDNQNLPSPNANAVARLRLRFSLWQNRLPLDALPVE